MSSVSFHVRRSLLLATIVALHGSAAFQFRCKENVKNYTCTVTNYSPALEGTFLFNHVPNRTDTIEFKNLILPIVNGALLSHIPPTVSKLSFSDSSKVHIVIVPRNISIEKITLSLSLLGRIRFERNCPLSILTIFQSTLTMIPPTLSNLPNLSFFKLSLSPIETINLEQFCNFTQLKTVTLNNNLIGSLEFKGALNPRCSPVLEKLTLGSNKIKVVNMTVFASMRALETIDLEDNLIETVVGQFNNRNIKTVILSRNNLLTIELCGWSTLVQIVSFSFHSNNLQQIPKCLGRWPKVKFLNFNQNKLTRVAMEAFAMLKELEQLFFSNNAIATVTCNNRQSVPPSLKEIYLKHNPLQFMNLTNVSLASVKVYT
ncbi:leucine-rich repeat and death domain-containing protein 1-like [Anopheles maculipalpis]|uniref:leucine-rich repeat and death domain-containing protein 1-like n=1 Tax=Anopheles maculipalpis TaxID=1496333 RepID=UPI00215937C6|nr:leucine-rich repeat and death domain-containing protein 1-like [Anopheles maculipalpis]